MDGDDMRRGNSFFRRNQYKIAAVCVLAAIVGLVGVYAFTEKESGEEQKQQVALEETKQREKQPAVKQDQKKETEEKTEQKEEEKTKKTSSVIYPKREDVIRKTTQEPDNADNGKAQEQAETVETLNVQNAARTELHFNADAGLIWPVNGAVILDYSMDKTVYFSTLDQYKYNPAVIISGNVNDQVQAAASGKITDISTNEVTGCTVTMDLGDGYTAIYGQLKEVPYEAGAYLEAGNALGFVNEPTKYFSMEGSNLYFALEKDGEPVNPVEFFQ